MGWSEANALLRKMSQELSSLIRSPAEQAQLKRNVTEKARRVLERDKRVASAQAVAAAISGVDNATLHVRMHTGDVATKLDAMKGEADALVKKAVVAAEKGSNAARSALAWARELP